MSKHELTDAHIPSIVRFGVGLFLLMVVAMILMWFMFHVLAAEEPVVRTSPLLPEREVPPQPRLQVNPEQDLEAMRAAEQQRLSSFGWVDREAGIAHIPIDVAIEKLLVEGMPAATRDGRQ